MKYIYIIACVRADVYTIMASKALRYFLEGASFKMF